MKNRKRLNILMTCMFVTSSTFGVSLGNVRYIKIQNNTEATATVEAGDHEWRMDPGEEASQEITVNPLRSNYLKNAPILYYNNKTIQFEPWAKDKINEFFKVMDPATSHNQDAYIQVARLSERDNMPTLWLPIIRATE